MHSLFILLLALPSFAQHSKARCENGERLLKEQLYVEAAREFEHGLKADPRNKRCQAKYQAIRFEASERAVSAAQLLVSANRIKEAVPFLEDALRFDPNNAAAAQWMTWVTDRLKDDRLTNADVIQLVSVGLSTDVIAQKIRMSRCNFDTSATALADLKARNVPEQVILVMLRAGEPAVGQTRGTGFAVSTAGHILTNEHVIKQCKAFLEKDGERHELKTLVRDPDNDLALLKAPIAFLAPAIFSSAVAVKVGQKVSVAGFPLPGVLASSVNLTVGTVSALAGNRDNASLMQITAPVHPGNSGGPVLDENGYVVGVASAKIDQLRALQFTGTAAENVGFAIKGSVVRAFLEANAIDIRYSQGASGPAVETTEIYNRARQFTVAIKCGE